MVVRSSTELDSYKVTVTEGEHTTINGVSTGNYDRGTSITVTVAVDDGYSLELLVDGNSVELTDNTYTFTVTAATAIQSVATPIEYEITMT